MNVKDAVTITQTGVRVATSTSSARAQIPNTAAGVNPKAVRVVASVVTYVRFGGASVTAVNTDAAVQPGDSTIFNVAGQTGSGALYVAGITETGAGVLQVSPLDDV